MGLVTNDQVKAIIDTDRDTQPFIETADLIVSEQLVGLGLSDARLMQIELWLSAHFVAMAEEKGGFKSSRVGESEDTYNGPGQNAVGLASTRYGLQAIALDTTGTLRSLNRATLDAQFGVIGTYGDC